MKLFKRWILVLVLLTLSVCLASCGKNNAQGQEEIRLIVESLLAKGEYAQAAAKAEGLEESEFATQLLAYCRACEAGEAGQYDTALPALKELGDYRDSANMAAYYAARQQEAKAAAGEKPVENRIAAAEAYGKLPEFRDSEERAAACLKAAYDYAAGLAEQKQFDAAREAFLLLGGYEDSAEMAKKMEADALYEAGDRKGAFAVYQTLGPQYQTHAAELMNQYDEAGELKKQGKYAEAALAYEALGDYMDSAMQVTDCRYRQAGKLLGERKFEEAEALYASLGDYQDSLSQITECRYQKAVSLAKQGRTEEALAVFEELGDYKDSKDYVAADQYRKAAALLDSGKYQEAIAAFETIVDYGDSRFMAVKAAADEQYAAGDIAGAWLRYRDLDEAYQTHLQDYQAMLAAAEEARKNGQYDEAEKQYLVLGTYEDADQAAVRCRYEKALSLLEKKQYDEAEMLFTALEGYEDSASMVLECRYRKAAALADTDRFEEADALFQELGEYKDSQGYLDKIRADRLYGQGDMAGAWEYYQNLDESLRTFSTEYENLYSSAAELRAQGEYDLAKQQFQALGGYKDAAALARQCVVDKADAYMADHYYTEALQIYEELKDTEKINECHYQYGVFLRENGRYAHAVKQFQLCAGYRDSGEQIAKTGLQASEDGDLEQAFTILKDGEPDDGTREAVYRIATQAAEKQEYDLAVSIYEWLGTYRDAPMEKAKCRNLQGMALYEQGEYDRSIAVFSELGEEFNAADKISMVRYAQAKKQMEDGAYAEARMALLAIGDYQDSRDLLTACCYEYGKELYGQGRLQEALDLFGEIPEEEYKETTRYMTECRYRLAVAAEEAGDPGRAAALLELCGDYQDSEARLLEDSYLYAVQLKEASDVSGAVAWFVKARAHQGVSEQLDQVAAFCDSMGMSEDAGHVRQTALWIHAENAMDAGDYVEAAACYAQVTDPDLPKDREKQANSLYGDELLAREKYGEARAAFTRAGETEKILKAWDAEGEALFAQGQFAEARAAFTQAGETEKILKAWEGEGEALFAVGQFADAKKAFTEAGNRARYEDAVFEQAKALLEAGDAAASYECIKEIEEREDVQAFLKENQAYSALRVKVGQVLTMGLFEQDNDPDNGGEPVEWIVLAVEDEKALVTSRYALDCRPYNTSAAHVTWAKCTLRKWLNTDFLSGTFTEEQQAAILATVVDNGKAQGNPAWKISGGKNTEDRIFLLSYQEADVYFAGAEARMCPPTDYAKARGAYTKESSQADGRACGWWWLRSPGHSDKNAARIGTDGNRSNDKVDSENICVRPVFWVDLNAGVL